jgi:hypothetical protein
MFLRNVRIEIPDYTVSYIDTQNTNVYVGKKILPRIFISLYKYFYETVCRKPCNFSEERGSTFHRNIARKIEKSTVSHQRNRTGCHSDNVLDSY